MKDAWERINGVWVGAAGDVSPELCELVRGWVAEIPPAIMADLSAHRCSVYVVRRLREFHEAYGGGADWEPPGVYSPGAWREGRRLRRLVLLAEEFIPTGASQWRPTLRHPWMRYVFRHEVGHAWDDASTPRACFAEPFRSLFLEERRQALESLAGADVRRLEYFLGRHWTFGLSEAFAEAFAAHFGETPPAPDGKPWGPLFRKAFAACCAHVSALVERAVAMEAAA